LKLRTKKGRGNPPFFNSKIFYMLINQNGKKLKEKTSCDFIAFPPSGTFILKS